LRLAILPSCQSVGAAPGLRSHPIVRFPAVSCSFRSGRGPRPR
jgi:hypothetical protein